MSQIAEGRKVTVGEKVLEGFDLIQQDYLAPISGGMAGFTTLSLGTDESL